MQHLTKNDLKAWVTAVTHPLASADSLTAWLEGPLRKFFPFKGVVLGHGELVAGQLNVTHMLATGHDDAYLRQLPTTFELNQRGSLRWWFSSRQPFHINPKNPSEHASAFELDEIERFGFGNVAGHGVLNVKANAGIYFGFAGVREPLGDWHLEALTLIAPVLNDLMLSHIALTLPAVASGLDGLTPRQKEIVRQLAAGKSNKGIAQSIGGITEKSVRNQLAKVYARVGVCKRTELIALLR
ncbi:transcriptional regulator EpsA [Variovorax sp. PBL-H6]|uniref:helix-turn-helix transcriptional regulator n=1 Tax=Variovorax sp. PBL-H6 TaxID=434009 RepID=UPI001315E6B3|nr:helix-turn-helix transcriptional regulator [Variovorax sp. PBL-H6]VTU35083.1 transcriptional regulator EpsA [Variovorax sp. PBL-H6]